MLFLTTERFGKLLNFPDLSVVKHYKIEGFLNKSKKD